MDQKNNPKKYTAKKPGNWIECKTKKTLKKDNNKRHLNKNLRFLPSLLNYNERKKKINNNSKDCIFKKNAKKNWNKERIKKGG